MTQQAQAHLLAERWAGCDLKDIHPEEREFYILQAMRRINREEQAAADKQNA